EQDLHYAPGPMFATILGALPRPAHGSSDAEAVEIAIRAQEAAGLEPVTDGRLAGSFDQVADGSAVEAWGLATSLTTRAVKATLPGPFSLAIRLGPSATAVQLADELRQSILALAAAGCPLIEIEESEAQRIGRDPAERATFRDAHLALTDGV